MIESFEFASGQLVFGKGDYTYQRVIDDFVNSKFVGIITFNISSKKDLLLDKLKHACKNGTEAVIITNIPKRYPSYFGIKYKVAAKNEIDLYKQRLNPANYGMRLSPYFSFDNHSKIILTDNIAYWGSSNFSDESSDNFECGTISTDKELINYLKREVFAKIQEHSVPYFEYNFAIAIANLGSLIPVCKIARRKLFDAAFVPWSDYDTNFEEKWIYRTTDSGITLQFLRNFIGLFSQFGDALDVIDNIVDAFEEVDEIPDEVQQLEELFIQYNESYEKFYEVITDLFENLEDVANYDVSEEASKKIVDDYGMVAYDDAFDHYAELAMQECFDDYESLIKDAKPSVIEALQNLDKMVDYFEKLKQTLSNLLQVNKKIDNTHIHICD